MIKPRWNGRASAVLGSLLCATVWSGVAHAAPGDVDTTFGTGGKVSFSPDLPYASAESVAVQTDGKIVAGGYFVDFDLSGDGLGSNFGLTRRNSDGTPDTTFGNAGVVSTDFDSPDDGIYEIALQSDGKIVAGGYTVNEADGYEFALARYNTNGTLDSSFGDGGKVTTALDGDYSYISSLAVQSDGKIIAAGTDESTGPDENFVLRRYNSDGTLDTTFGSNGTIITDFNGGGDFLNSVVVQSDGKIIAGGQAHANTPRHTTGYNFALVRYNTDGTLDTSFGVGGKVASDFRRSRDGIYSLVLQSDGKIVAGGYSNSGPGGIYDDLAVARYNTDGTLDTTFGTNGVTITDLSGSTDYIYSIALQSNGKIVAGGWTDSGTDEIDFSLTRYTSSGALDASFGSNGIVITDWGSDAEVVNSIALQNDGKIVAAGFVSNDSDGSDFTIARYIGDPTPPTISVGDLTKSEGNSGSTTFDFPVTLSTSSTQSVTVQFATANGTALSGNNAPFDYTARTGTLTFSPGQTTRNISVVVRGDSYSEANETFLVNLNNATNGVSIAKAQGVGTIQNDDSTTLPAVSVQDVAISEGNSGTKTLIFTFTLDKPSATAVTLNYSTQSGSATAGNASPADYSARSGILTFSPNQTSRTVAVTIYGDTRVELNENFNLNLSNVQGATMLQSYAVGIINNDD